MLLLLFFIPPVLHFALSGRFKKEENTCAFEFRVEKVGQSFDAEAERGVAAGQVSVGRQRRAGSGRLTP